MWATLLGGIGLFLLGMVLMTDSLKLVAGDALRRILSRFVSGPLSAMTSGAVSTAIVQSSSATTLTTIGFVSAGLITFPQAVGVIFGANLGTTSTGWIVSLLGFKLDLTVVTLPMIGIGVLMRLLLRGTWSHAGLALAGFGLIFVGIDQLQDAMAGLTQYVDPTRVSGDTFTGRILLALLGVAMTIVMQSSSAAVATTLAALNTQAISLDQAAVLVIGQNVGTTLKVILVSIGASTAVKRTAAAHILFNVVTAGVAFVLLTPFVTVVRWAMHGWEPTPGVLTIAAFHTAFNLLGVLLFLPWLKQFSRLVERLVQQRGAVLTRHLDKAVATVPAVAIEATIRTLHEIAAEVFRVALRRLEPSSDHSRRHDDLKRVDDALKQVRQFLSDTKTNDSETQQQYRRHVSILHAIDHLDEFIEDCRTPASASLIGHDVRLKAMAEMLQQALLDVLPALSGEDGTVASAVARIREVSAVLREQRRTVRPTFLEEAAAGRFSPDSALERLDASAWFDGLAYHAWRALHHLDIEASSVLDPLPTSENGPSQAYASLQNQTLGGEKTPFGR